MKGKRLYEYARQGKELPGAIEPRPVTLCQANLDGFDSDSQEFVMTLETSGGFYVRSLVNDMGKAVGSCAHMTKLVRTRQGPWTLDSTLPILDTMVDEGQKLVMILGALEPSIDFNQHV
jgi:tRNA pseudouridine55 synthase